MGEKVVEGWVNNVKVLGKIAFLEVIDDLSLGVVTVVVKRREEPGLWEVARGVKIGSAVRVRGVEPERVVSRKGRELHARSIEVLAEPEEPLPIDVTGKTPAGLATRLDYRYVSLRLPRFRAVFEHVVRSRGREASRRRPRRRHWGPGVWSTYGKGDVQPSRRF